jgi:hypothetical protein
MAAMMPATGMKIGPMECRPSMNSLPSPVSGLRIDAMAPATAHTMMI